MSLRDRRLARAIDAGQRKTDYGVWIFITLRANWMMILWCYDRSAGLA